MAKGPASQRVGWLAFSRWKRRFLASTSVPFIMEEDLLYVCRSEWADCLDDWNHAFQDDDFQQKIAFMRAYLRLLSTDSADFAGEAQRLLVCQERARAPRVYGCWFSQSDPEMFGAGSSLDFQGTQISLFCEAIEQIDIADVSRLLPFDDLLVRKPDAAWTATEVEDLGAHIKWDLAFDGDKTDLDLVVRGQFASFRLTTPDYGIPLDD